MKQRVFVITLLLTATLSGIAQDRYAYGGPEELRGVTRVYVDTAADLDLRNVFKKILEQERNLTVVDQPEEATHWVIFRWFGPSPYWARTIIVTNVTAPMPRLLFSVRNSEAELDDLTRDAAKAVAKAYRNANTTN